MSDQDRLEELLLDWEELYEQGRDVPAAELCRGCPELTAAVEREIAKLRRLRPTILQSTLLPDATVANAPVPELGGVRYRPLRFHAAGGLGEVFVAHDEELGREVALKRIQGRAAGHEASRQRFVAEAEITGRLEHPGIVPVYGMGMDASGQPFYAMRFIQGGSLKDAVDSVHANPAAYGPGLRQLVQQLVAVCNAVAYAHSRGVVHRDLKPANVMLGKYGETLVVDWGLAKVVGREQAQTKSEEETLPQPSAGDDGRTIAGEAMGTPAYMSPEQANGRWGEVGPASDIFSLGATLYHLLTGRPPYAGPRALEAARLGRCERPRKVDPAEVPAALEAVCLKAMAPVPKDRYATALDLAKDLERWLGDEPVSCYRDPVSARWARWARRRRTLVTSGGVAVLLIAVSCVAGLFLHQRAEYERQRQALEYEQARQRQLAEHRLQLENAARADLKLALVEAHTDRFAGAEQVLDKAAAALGGEPELAELRIRIEVSRDRLARLAAFYRALGRAEYMTAQISDANFSESDEKIIARCEAALKELGVGGGEREWWNHLPADELLLRQKERLQEDAVVALGVLALWRVKQGLMRFDFLALPVGSPPDSKAKNAYLSAREHFRVVQAYYEAVHRRRMAAADCLDLFCRWRFQEPLPPSPLKLEPLDATDAYFLGLIHAFIGDAKKDRLWDTVFTVASRKGVRLTGLDYDTPLPTSERLLRTAADLSPEHYWAHFWLGRCLILRKDYASAELAFNTCVALRPDYSHGYTQRGEALFGAAKKLDEQARRDQLSSPLDRIESWIGLVARPRLHFGDTLLDVSLYVAGHVRDQRALEVARARSEVLARGLKGLDEGLTRLPDEAAIHWYRAFFLAQMGRQEEKVAAMTTGAELLACQGQGGLLKAEGLTGLAAALRRGAEVVAARQPNNPEVQALLALACLAVGEDTAAGRAADASLAKAPQNGPARAVRGILLLRQQKPADALRYLDAVSTKGPGGTLATFGRAGAYEKAGDWVRARQEYDRLLVGTGPAEGTRAVAGWLQLEAHLGRARAAKALGQLEDARSALEDARAIDPRALQQGETKEGGR